MSHSYRLLYIDDDAALARLVQKDFVRRGYMVDLAPDGEEGLKALSQGQYDVCALDHTMPGREGLEILPEILTREDAPPVVYVTGIEDSRVAVAALKAGAADYVIKEASGEFRTFLAKAVEDAIVRRRLEKAHEAAQEEMKRERDRAEALLREVNHRVGNSLQLVASFVHLHRRQLGDSAAAEALAETQVRIDAIAQVHRRLYRSHDMRGVALDEYLDGLVAELSHSLTTSKGLELTLRAEPTFISTDQAVALGVIVAELVTNAVKYAYGPDEKGQIRVIGESTAGGRVRLRVEDDGIGIGDGAPKGTGLGSQILKAMAIDLRADIRFDSGEYGTRAILEFGPEEVSAPSKGA